MPEPTNTSFIPKRGPTQKENRPGRRKVYVGTIIVRILFFAAVVAAGSVYAYERKLDSNLDAKVFELNNSISKFNDAEMQRVIAFDTRLSEMSYRLAHSASIVSLLEAVERATVDDVQITQLTIERPDDKNFLIGANLKTPSFDVALFQRQILEKTDTLSVSSISDLNLQNTPPKDPLFRSGGSLSDEVVVSFKAALTVDVQKVPHTATVSNVPSPDTLDAINMFNELNPDDSRPSLGAERVEENTKPNEI
ncbi:MAG TPA: hypothetical protein PKD95_01840 [Candidatus Paceibacterota bacterium]|nr:hypothetical protein [Candidatus Paceibacterota bacterium]